MVDRSDYRGVSHMAPGLDMMMQDDKDDKAALPEYTLQRVIQFLQTEWNRREVQRADYEADRAELDVNLFHCDCQIKLLMPSKCILICILLTLRIWTQLLGMGSSAGEVINYQHRIRD